MSIKNVRVYSLRVKAPLFSTKLPYTYQISSATILPPISTLLGALAFSLSRIDPKKGKTLEELSSEQLENISKTIIFATCRLPSNLTLTIASIMLKRSLALEFRKEDKKEKPSDIINPRMDARRREYVFVSEIDLFYIFDESELLKNNLDEKIIAALPLMERLGDTESLISPVKWEITSNIKENIERDVKLNTATIGEAVERIIGDAYLSFSQIWPTFDKRSKLHPYYLPLKQTTKESMVFFEPQTYTVKRKESTSCISFNAFDEDITVLIPPRGIEREWKELK